MKPNIIWSMKVLRRFVGVIFICLLICNGGGDVFAAGKEVPSAGKMLTSKAIHPKMREWASPTGGEEVAINPSPLLWPAVKGNDVRYRVRLSQDPDFPRAKTIVAEDLRWAMFNPHAKLTAGTWYWQYAVSRRARPGAWSRLFSFNVPASVRVFETPTASKMLAACPLSHPRILMTAGELESFRRHVKKSPEALSIVRMAKGYLGNKLLCEESGRPRLKGKNRMQDHKFAQWASKALGNRMSSSVSNLAMAYLLTGDNQFGREAVRIAVHVAKWDPNGVTSSNVSDFADGACLRAMALAYDSCYELLTGKEKALLLNAIKVRADRLFKRWCNNLETRVFSAHIWQHILHEFTEAAFATLGKIPEAEQWATYVYELWLARVPLLGGDDGGWANGNNYFGTNFGTLIYMPTFFERLTGVNFFNNPWYQNTIYYLLYTWPPHSLCDGFGDGYERRGTPPINRIAFADVLGRELSNPYASWYLVKCLEGTGQTLRDDWSLKWYRLRSQAAQKPIPPKATFDLPQARAFRDIGVVAMHTNMAETPHNLMVAFRSGPYGCYNHAHANQNAFNILFGGKRLFNSTGYYIGYGDEHFLGWYKHSRGHNTILVDGKGQGFGTESYGWIARYLHGERLSYCLGDASNAYGNAGLTHFRRHLALLRPSTIVIYDELEADHPAAWSWLLHSPERISVNAEKQRLLAAVETARSQIDLFGSVPLNINVDSRFKPPALNWRKMKDSKGNVIKYADQWHVTAASSKKTSAMRYLAIIQVRPTGDNSKFNNPVAVKDGWLQVGSWRVRAELNTSNKAVFEVCSLDGEVALAAGKPYVTISRKRYQANHPDSTILVETSAGKPIVQESVDELPQASR